MTRFCLVALLFSFFTVHAGTPAELKLSLGGKVIDSLTREPLAGASIYLTDDKIGTIADAQGKFFISDIPAGHHIIEISHTGYSTLVLHIELNENTERDFILSSIVLENQGVIITGTAGAISSRKMPVPVTSLRRSALIQSASTNIIDAITQVPGVSQISTGPAIAKPIIRGLGYNRVLTINEGIRQEGQQWGDEHGIEIDEFSVGRVEILKGPASLIYGSDALAGVINFITNIPGAEGTVKGSVLGNYQTNNSQYAFNGNIAGNKNGFNWNFYGTVKNARDYHNRSDKTVLNSRSNEGNFGGYAGVNKSWGYSHLIFSSFNQHAGIVEGERDPSGNFLLYAGTVMERTATDHDLRLREMLIPHQKIVHNKLISDNNFVIKGSRLKINLGLQQNVRKEFGNPLNPDERELHFDLKTFNYNLHWQLPEKNEWHRTIGVTGMVQSNSNKGEERVIPAYDLIDAGVFAFFQRSFKNTTVSGGVRFDNRSIHSFGYGNMSVVKFVQFDGSFSNVSGSAGISYEPSPHLTLKANLARGFRAPSLAELGSNGAHEGSNRYEYGNTSLRSETSLQFDAGADFNYEHFSLDIAGFYNSMSNFIFYRKLQSLGGGDSVVNVDGTDIVAFRFNQQDAALYGFELSVDIHPHPFHWLHFENTVSYVRGRFFDAVDGSRNLPLIPATKITSELKGDFKKIGSHLMNAYLKAGAVFTLTQSNPFTGYLTETATPGYTVWNAGAGADFGKASKTCFSLHLAVTNISDVAYQNHLSRLKYAAINPAGRAGVFNTGRNFSVKLLVPFQFPAASHR